MMLAFIVGSVIIGFLALSFYALWKGDIKLRCKLPFVFFELETNDRKK